jgi:hypothetical protein
MLAKNPTCKALGNDMLGNDMIHAGAAAGGAYQCGGIGLWLSSPTRHWMVGGRPEYEEVIRLDISG